MKESNICSKTDVIGQPVPGEHVNLLKQKTTPDDNENVKCSDQIIKKTEKS